MKYNKDLKWTHRIDKYGKEVHSARVGRKIFYIIDDGTIGCPVDHYDADKYFAALTTDAAVKFGEDNGLIYEAVSFLECFTYLSTHDGSRAQALATAKNRCAENWRKLLKVFENNNNNSAENS